MTPYVILSMSSKSSLLVCPTSPAYVPQVRSMSSKSCLYPASPAYILPMSPIFYYIFFFFEKMTIPHFMSLLLEWQYHSMSYIATDILLG